MRKLSIIIVNYNVKESIIKCIDSIYDSLPNDFFELLVVDNNSIDGSVKEIKKNFPGVDLTLNQVNRGFAAACNQGLKASKGEYILLLNPDTVVNHSLIEMVDYMEKNERTGILGCKILKANGSIQKTAFPPHSFLNDIIFGPKFRWAWLLRRQNRRVIRQCNTSQEPFEVGWVSGACLMTKQQTIQDIGLFDERFFLGAEDVDLCCRAAKRGWKVIYFPGTQVVHIGEQSKNKELALKIRYHYQERIHFAQKYYGTTELGLIKLISLMELLAKRIILESRPNTKKKENKERLKGYKQAVNALLKRMEQPCSLTK